MRERESSIAAIGGSACGDEDPIKLGATFGASLTDLFEEGVDSTGLGDSDCGACEHRSHTHIEGGIPSVTAKYTYEVGSIHTEAQGSEATTGATGTSVSAR